MTVFHTGVVYIGVLSLRQWSFVGDYRLVNFTVYFILRLLHLTVFSRRKSYILAAGPFGIFGVKVVKLAMQIYETLVSDWSA